MHRVRDRTACGSLISERPGWVICACRGPGGPPLIIASAQEGDDEEEAAEESVCLYTLFVSLCAGVYQQECEFSTCVYF